MGVGGNLPIALAPGMGLNAYFTYNVVGYRGEGSVSLQPFTLSINTVCTSLPVLFMQDGMCVSMHRSVMHLSVRCGAKQIVRLESHCSQQLLIVLIVLTS